MGIQERRNRQRQFLRQEILDAAREMFVRDGYEGVTMRKVAEKIEYSPTAIYYHFKDKAEILTQIVYETFMKLNQRMDEALSQPRANSLQCLYAGMRTYVDFAVQHPSHYYVSFMAMCPGDSPDMVYSEVHEAGMKAFNYLRSGIRRAMEDGLLHQAEVELSSQAAWSSLHGVAALLVSQAQHFPFVEHNLLINQTLRGVLLGMGADPALVEEAIEAKALAVR